MTFTWQDPCLNCKYPCLNSKSISDWISVNPDPISDWIVNPDPISDLIPSPKRCPDSNANPKLDPVVVTLEILVDATPCYPINIPQNL